MSQPPSPSPVPAAPLAATKRAPIAVMSFNRPDYFRTVLQSFVAQQGADLDSREIALFQDGAVNRHSGEARADRADIAACVETFRALVPRGRVEESPENLGVALNFERAELWAFERLGADAAIFLEDDLVLQPNYIAALDSLLDLARSDKRIGYVAAYGDHLMPRATQATRPMRYIMLGHNWGFGLTRHQWRRNRPFVDAYLELLRGCDYRARPRKEIHKLYHSWDVGCPGDSQDVTKTLASYVTRGVKLNTSAVLATYIGAVGLHMKPRMFDERRYAATEVFQGTLPPPPPLTVEDYDRIHRDMGKWANGRPCDLS